MSQVIDMDAILLEVAESLGPTIKEAVQSAINVAINTLSVQFSKNIDEVRAELTKEASQTYKGLEESINSIASAVKSAEANCAALDERITRYIANADISLGKTVSEIMEEIAAVRKDIQSLEEPLALVSKANAENTLAFGAFKEQSLSSLQNQDEQLQAMAREIGPRIDEIEASLESVQVRISGAEKVGVDLQTSCEQLAEKVSMLSVNVAGNYETIEGILSEVNAEVGRAFSSIEDVRSAHEKHVAYFKIFSNGVPPAVAEQMSDLDKKFNDRIDSAEKSISEKCDKEIHDVVKVYLDVSKMVDSLSTEVSSKFAAVGDRISSIEEAKVSADSVQGMFSSLLSGVDETRGVVEELQASVAQQAVEIRGAINDKVGKEEFELAMENTKSVLREEIHSFEEELEKRVVQVSSHIDDVKKEADESVKKMGEEIGVRIDKIVEGSSDWVKQVEQTAVSAVEKARVISGELSLVTNAVADLDKVVQQKYDDVIHTISKITDPAIESIVESQMQFENNLSEKIKEVADQNAAAVSKIEVSVRASLNGLSDRVESVEKAVSELPGIPELPDVGGMVEEAVAGTIKIVRADLSEEVREVISEKIAIARAETNLVLADEIRKEVARIPAPKDGEMPKIREYVEGQISTERAVVAHLGGLWQARCDTKEAPSPESRDWAPLSTGVSGLHFETSSDGREVYMSVKMSDGTEKKSTIELPVSVWQDVYSAEREYRKADEVTHAGCVWHATRSGVLGTPGKTSDWKLKVKCGRDGKDGKDIVRHVGEFYGEWEIDKLYKQHSIVEHAGVHWMAKHDTNTRPPWATLRSNETWLKMGD